MVKSQRVKGTAEGGKQKGRRAGLGVRKAISASGGDRSGRRGTAYIQETLRQLTVAKTHSLKTRTHKKSVDAGIRKPGLEAKRKWSANGSPGSVSTIWDLKQGSESAGDSLLGMFIFCLW